jgi:hypothetical protein
MALHKVIEKHKVSILGQEITYTNKFIKYTEKTSYGFKPSSSLISYASSLFRYTYEHAYLPPTIAIIGGQKYIVPSWKKVHPNTTLKDIEWIKPVKIEAPIEKETWRFESSSEKGLFYKVTKQGDQLKCNCSGFWRAKDRSKGCKHVQEVRKQLSK